MRTLEQKFQLAIVSVFFIFDFVSHPLWAESDHAAKLAEGARREGKLVWYTSMAIDTSKPLLDAFLAQYPFVKADLVRLGEEQLLNRIMAETRAGKWLFDAVSSSGIQVLAERKFLTPHASPEAVAFAKEFKDRGNLWTAVYNNNLVLTYNTQMVSDKDAPKDYKDLLEPQWKGKVIFDSSDYDWYGTLFAVWGRDKAMEYMKRLARQEPRWRRGHGLVAQLVAAGESPLGWAYNFRIERMKKDGAPVDWVATFDPIVTTINGIGLSAKASNPNTAKLFVDFILSKKAQEMVRGMRRIPSRGDVEPLVPKMDQSKLKLRLVPTEVFLNIGKHAEGFRETFDL